MNFLIRIWTGEDTKLAYSLPEADAWAPEQWDLSAGGGFLAVKDIPRTPISCEVCDPCPDPDAIISTEHQHDGTLTFTLCAITAVVNSAEEYMRKEGGSWCSSKVYVKGENVGGRHPYHEGMCIFLKRLPVTRSAE